MSRKNERPFFFARSIFVFRLQSHYRDIPVPAAGAAKNARVFVESCAMSGFNALDKLDRAILRRLQDNGRETYDVIGEQVGLSPSAVLRRVKRLEDTGVINRYVALVPPEAVGLGLTAYLNVRLEKHTESHKRNPMDLFRASVQTWPEVVECAALTGEMDYLLRVVVADMAHYSRFIMDTLLKHPSVQDCKTSFVLDRVKATTAVPV
jgi:Lrp/AsnC family transcriptional regulator, leucine-responsive regulatory protein